MAAPISILNGQYQVNGGTWVSTTGTVSNGDTLKVRRISSSSYSTTVTCNVTVGDYSTSFSITTRSNSPTPFTLTPVTNAEVITQYESNMITLSGL